MPNHTAHASSWNPQHVAVSADPAPGTQRIARVRHDSYPYQEDWDEAVTGWDGLFRIANRYLNLASIPLGLPAAWLADLEASVEDFRAVGSLRWLRDRTDPRHSYWVERRAHGGTGSVLDRSAVLLAGLSAPFIGPLYGGQGLRVVIQIGPPTRSGPVRVRITGVSSTLPSSPKPSIAADVFAKLPQRIAMAYGLSDNVKVVDLGIWLPDDVEKDQRPIVFAKTAPTSEERRGEYSFEGTSHLLVVRLSGDGEVESLVTRPLVTSADADVFVQDPVSRNGAASFSALRPSRSWTVLDPQRVNVQLGALPAGGPGLVQLVDPHPGGPDFQVMNCRLVDLPSPESAPKEVPSSVHDHTRTNASAAANAFVHTSELFARLRQYGLPAATYFRFVTRPIDVRYRSGIIPGFGDGRTVNAQVRWTLLPDSSHKGTIEVRFALADLQSAVGRLPSVLATALERSPLGVASDPRWCWHEYCHVLLTAAVGDLELRFAHSAGDAIGAILSDPDSRLARAASGASANTGFWRGVSFPWAQIPRRHDRDVQEGWGWTGAMNGREIYFAVPGLPDTRGYWTEQILSSSLFRLYRAIGGDSETSDGTQQIPDTVERRKAADYAVYLIMRTIQSLGAAVVTPSTTPNDFVDAMRKVDTATATAPGPGGYVGGTVHKVVQWAFERQGLYARPVPGSSVSGPAEIATVDLHIEDVRPKPDGPYSPVDLCGRGWHADPNFVRITKGFFSSQRRIRVKVQNRGPGLADNTRVEVWYARVTGGVIPPYPDPTQWYPLGSDTRTVPRRGSRTFGPFTWTPPAAPQEYAILVAATCDADRSNIDTATGYPCTSIAGPLEFLVACDNNLGLRTVMVE